MKMLFSYVKKWGAIMKSLLLKKEEENTLILADLSEDIELPEELDSSGILCMDLFNDVTERGVKRWGREKQKREKKEI